MRRRGGGEIRKREVKRRGGLKRGEKRRREERRGGMKIALRREREREERRRVVGTRRECKSGRLVTLPL